MSNGITSSNKAVAFYSVFGVYKFQASALVKRKERDREREGEGKKVESVVQDLNKQTPEYRQLGVPRSGDGGLSPAHLQGTSRISLLRGITTATMATAQLGRVADGPGCYSSNNFSLPEPQIPPLLARSLKSPRFRQSPGPSRHQTNDAGGAPALKNPLSAPGPAKKDVPSDSAGCRKELSHTARTNQREGSWADAAICDSIE